MKKSERQRIIKQLIHQFEIETQDELIQRLEEEGVHATQATISRDIRELGIVKTHGSNNQVTYAILPKSQTSATEEKLTSSVRDSVIRIEQVQFMVIVHTEVGDADVVTNFLDEVDYDEIAGTVAGADTIIIIARSELAAKTIVTKFEAMMI